MPSLTPVWSIAVGAVTKEGPQGRKSVHPVVSGGCGKRLSCLWALWWLSMPMGSAWGPPVSRPCCQGLSYKPSLKAEPVCNTLLRTGMWHFLEWTTTKLWDFILEKKNLLQEILGFQRERKTICACKVGQGERIWHSLVLSVSFMRMVFMWWEKV